ncbi:GntR family transcriptional regulator [Consotaella aegiceratis]|uniref:GntR family transcriptional regulator n=1 Tax=Consotaella aegiceratis TaxID=3097961 RepID=UPI002F417EC1
MDRLRGRLSGAENRGALYKRLRAGLQDVIAAGTLRRGEPIPGERVLAQGLSLSRVTVRKAIEGLVADGWLVRYPGTGTEVAGRVVKSLTRLTGFSEEITARGLQPGCIWLLRRRMKPSVQEAQDLDLAPGALVLRLDRVRTADGVPIALERAAVPLSALADPAAVDQSLYAALEAVGRAPVRAVQRLRACAATDEDARHLSCSPDTPLLLVERRCFDAGDRPVEVAQTRYLADAYDFVMELTR